MHLEHGNNLLQKGYILTNHGFVVPFVVVVVIIIIILDATLHPVRALMLLFCSKASILA